jgi:hypothetical protein
LWQLHAAEGNMRICLGQSRQQGCASALQKILAEQLGGTEPERARWPGHKGVPQDARARVDALLVDEHIQEPL